MDALDAETKARVSEANARLNKLFGELVSDLYAIRRKDGSKINISVSPHECTYNFYQEGSWMFCWTVHPDDRGEFHAFDYQPYGKGAKTGEAKRWRLVHLVTFAHRNKAKARAFDRSERYRKAHGG